MKRIAFLLLSVLPIISLAQNYEWVEEHRVNYNLNPEYPEFPVSFSNIDNSILSARMDSFVTVYSTSAFGRVVIESRDTNGLNNWQLVLSDQVEVLRVITDQTGEVYVGGRFQQDMYIGLTDTIPFANVGPSPNNIFMLRIGPNGNLIWKRNLSITWPGYDDFGALAIDQAKNCWYGITDFFDAKFVMLNQVGNDATTYSVSGCKLIGNFDFDPWGGFYISGSAGSGPFIMEADTFNAPFSYNMFLARFDPAGQPSWVQFAHDITFQKPMVVADAYGDARYAGNRFDSLSFDGNFIPAPLTLGDFFVFKCDTSGSVSWTLQQPPLIIGPFGSFKPGKNLFIDTDALGNLFMGGEQKGTVDWGNGYISSTPNSFDTKSAVACVDSSGDAQWVKLGGSSYSNYTHAVAASNGGTVYFAGSFRDTAFFDWHSFYTTNGFNYMIGKIRILPSSLNEFNNENNYSVFPNPSEDFIELSSQAIGAEVHIYDMTGRSIQKIKDYNGEQINVRELNKGCYLITIRKNQIAEHIKFIKSD